MPEEPQIDWQPVRIAPESNAALCHGSPESIANECWKKFQGAIIRVRPVKKPPGKQPCPSQNWYQIHPDDCAKVQAVSGVRDLVCEHSILAD